MKVGAIELAITFTPAYFALLECAAVIADEHGVDTAAEWGRRIVEADPMLFVSVDRPPPRLTIIQGGAA